MVSLPKGKQGVKYPIWVCARETGDRDAVCLINMTGNENQKLHHLSY